MQEHVMNISEMEHYLMKQGLSWRHGSLKWSGYKDHWYRESQTNEKLGCSLTDPMIAAVTPDNDRNRGRKNDTSDAKI